MKRSLLSLFFIFAAHSAMANVALEVRVSPLNSFPGATTKYVRVYNSGEVYRSYCEISNGHCYPATRLAVLSHYAMNHIFNLNEEARYGVIQDNTPLCAAVPSEAKTYTASNGSVLLENGTYPCGMFSMNQSDAAYYLLGVLRQYEN